MEHKQNRRRWQAAGDRSLSHPELAGGSVTDIHQDSRDEDVLYGRWSPRARTALAAASELGEGELARVYSILMGSKREADLLVRGLRRAAGDGSIRRLFGMRQLRREPREGDLPNRPPHDDHGVLLLGPDGRPALYLSEPYGLSADQFNDVHAFAAKWGLSVSIDARLALWNPGQTLGIAYSAPAKREEA